MLLKVVMVLIRDHGRNGRSLVRVPGRVEEVLALNIGNARMGLSVQGPVDGIFPAIHRSVLLYVLVILFKHFYTLKKN